MSSREWVIVAVLVLMLAGGTVVYQSIQEEKTAVRQALADAAERAGLDSDLVLAIGSVESGFRLGAVNRTGADGKRGGSYGATQISLKTARAYGFTGDPMDLTRDPALMALWTVKILRARPGGPPQNTDQAAAWWNAGHTSMAVVASTSSAWDYLDRLNAAYEREIAS